MSNDTQVKQEADVERWKRELSEAGWSAASATAWYAPDGGLYRGPYGAWKELQKRNGILTATDADAAKARDLIGNVNNYAEENGELSISAFGPLSTRIAEALATVRREVQIFTLRHAIEVADELEYELPQFQHMQGAEAVRKKLQAELAALEASANQKGEVNG